MLRSQLDCFLVEGRTGLSKLEILEDVVNVVGVDNVLCCTLSPRENKFGSCAVSDYKVLP